jgi:hypothetical protein
MSASYINNFLNRTVLLTAFFFTALFTTVHAADINLALGKPATQVNMGAKVCCIGNTDLVIA